MARQREEQDERAGDRYTMQAQYETDCPDDCGMVIEVGDEIAVDDDGGWVLYDDQHFPEG